MERFSENQLRYGKVGFMSKLFALVVGLLLFHSVGFAFAKDFFIAQNTAGNSNGSSCANALAVSFFNSAGNWGAGATQIGPGTTVHLCGTLTTSLFAQASGTSGNPITILFEAGGNLSQPFCPGTGCLNINNRSNIVVDGGTNGIIQATANGTVLANKQLGVGLSASPCQNCEVRNLTIANIYVHTSVTDDILDHTLLNSIIMSGSNWLFHDNTLHDAGWCIKNFYQNGDTNVKVYNNNIYNCDHGYSAAGYGAISATQFFFYNNHVHDYANWDTTSNRYHHDGVHAFGAGGASLTGLQIYNNVFDGNTGNNFTSHIYLEKPDSSPSLTNTLIFNNIVDGTNQPGGNFGLITDARTTGTKIYNNTIIGVNRNGSYCIIVSAGDTSIKNNVMSGCWAGIFQYQAAPSVTLDTNIYANIGSCGVGYSFTANCYGTLASWQTYSGQDVHSQLVPSADLNTNYQPNSSSPVIRAGVNLTSLGITALTSDKGGILRPANEAWDAGALQFAVPTSTPNPPTNLKVIQ